MYHKLEIIGNLGKDPVMRYLPSGKAVTNFNVATNRTYTNNNGEKIKETTWFRVSVFEKTAENCNQYLHKGSKVFVEGRLISDPKTGGPKVWEGKNGPGASFEITAFTVVFLSSKGEDESDEVDDEETETGESDMEF